MSLVVTGPVAKGVGDAIGLGSTAVTIWNIAKWPVLLIVVMGMLALLYGASPNVKLPSSRSSRPARSSRSCSGSSPRRCSPSTSPNFGSYNKTYGTLAASSSVLLWL